MVWPVDADVVDLVLAVAQLHDTVDDSSGISRQRSLRCLIGCRPADDCPRTFAVTSRDLTGLLCRFGCTSLEGDHGCCSGRLRSTATRLYEDLGGLDGR